MKTGCNHCVIYADSYQNNSYPYLRIETASAKPVSQFLETL